MAPDATEDDGEGTAESDTQGAATTAATDTTKRRIRTLAIFFIGIGVFAAVGAGLDTANLFLENLTTYFVSGGVVFAIGLVLLLLAR